MFLFSASVSDSELTAYVQPGTVTEGADVRLTCESGCDTPMNIVWFKDGSPVLNPVFQARRGDAGRYHCAIRGQESVRSASVALNVHCKYMNNTLKSSTYYEVFLSQASQSLSPVLIPVQSKINSKRLSNHFEYRHGFLLF